MSETDPLLAAPAPAAAPAPIPAASGSVTLGPPRDNGPLLKYLAGGVLMAMLFALAILNKMPAESFVTLAIGALGALGGHAAGSAGKQS